MQNLRWKIITIVTVLVVFAAVGVYPIVAARFGITSPSWLVDRQLKLGLDLKGGVHLVLRVQTDDALRIETESEAERLREALRTANIPVTSITATSPTEFKVEGVPPAQDAAFREAAVEADTNFNRASGDRRLVRLHVEAERADSPCGKRPLIRRGRRSSAASTSSASPSRALPSRAAGRSAARPASRRHRRQPREGDYQVHGSPGAEDRRAGAVGLARLVPAERTGAAGHGDPPGLERPDGRAWARRSTTW